MKLATILGLYFVSLGWLFSVGSRFTTVVQSQPTANSSNPAQLNQGAASGTNNSTTSQSPPASSSQTSNPASQTQPTAKPRHRRKKTIYPDCSNAPAPINPMAGNSADTNQTASGSARDGTANSRPGNKNSTQNKAAASPSKPCPPQKKVVRDGGSDEPAIQLIGGNPAGQASDQHTAEQLTSTTEENLKKIEGKQLSPSQQEMLNQIKQFMEQSKQAVASGDSDRGRNLALKARLLSDELVKP